MGIFDSEQKSILWWLLFPAAIVLLGCVLHGIADEGFSFAERQTKLRDEIDERQPVVDSLSDQLSTKKRMIIEGAFNKDRIIDLETQSERARKLGLRLRSLKETKETLIADRKAFESNFFSYRKAAVQQAWQDAVGQSYDYVNTSDGKEYKDVVIKRITMEGMEVAHAYGRATILYRQLPLELQLRFRWAEAQQLK